jgi:hypothetical protein
MKKLIPIVLEILGWLQIAVSPLLIGLFLGCCVYYFIPSFIGILLGGFVALTGIFIGIVWATRISNKYGTNTMLKQLNHKAEFDDDLSSKS